MSFSMYKKWDTHSVRSWKETLSRGRLSFLLTKGINFALFYFIITSIGFGVFSSKLVFLDVNTFLILGVTGLLAGLIMANHIWKETNKSFNDFKRQS